MALTMGGGPILPIATAAGISGAHAVSEAEDAGLTGADKAGYITRAATIEALPALIFQRLGLGGVEKAMGEAFRQPAREGVRQALAQAGKQTFAGELPEEYLTAAAEIANRKLSGVDPTTLSAGQIAETFRDVTLQTLMMGGAANAPSVVRGALNDQADARAQDQSMARVALEGLGNGGDRQMILDPATGEYFQPAMITTPRDEPVSVTPDVIETVQTAPDLLRLYGIRGVADETNLNRERESQFRERAMADDERRTLEAERTRLVRELADEAESASIDRTQGEESIRRADDEALRQQELAELIDNAIGPKSRDGEPQVAVGREPDADPVNEERARFDAGRAAADQVETEYQAELKAINARRSAPKSEKIGKDQAVALRRDALERRNQRMAEAIERAARGEPVSVAPPTARSVPESVPQAINEGTAAKVEGSPTIVEESSTPTVPGPTQQDQDAAVAELERIVGELATRTGKVEDFPALLSQLAPLGYRVDRSQGLPDGAEKKRTALEAAAKARGVDLNTIARQAQERALKARPAPRASATSAKVPLMVTKRMTNELRGLGYKPEAINRMTPQEANTILENGTQSREAAARLTKPVEQAQDAKAATNAEQDTNADDGVPFARDSIPEDDGKQGGSLMLPGQEFTNEDLIRQQRKAEGDRTPVSGRKGWQKLREESDRTDQRQGIRKAIAQAMSIDGKPAMALSRISSVDRSASRLLSDPDAVAVIDPLFGTVQVAKDATVEQAKAIARGAQTSVINLNGKTVEVQIDGGTQQVDAKAAVDLVRRRLSSLRSVLDCLGG
jgi:hypothetical protein